MNFSQKLGLFILLIITVAYIYFSFFSENFKLPELKNRENNSSTEFNPLENYAQENSSKETITSSNEVKTTTKSIKIFVIDKTGNTRAVNRTCNTNEEKSCFEYAIKELLKAPSSWEKSKGFVSEIPQNTKLLSIREASGNILIDLSSDFETGGGAESTYLRIEQVIKTALANTSAPVYLYINGKQANVIGGEGVMIKQPLNERSLDE